MFVKLAIDGAIRFVTMIKPCTTDYFFTKFGYQGAGKRPRQCCHPKGGNGAEGGQRARSLEGPKGPRVAKTCESEGPKGPRTSKAKCPPRRLPVLLYVFHNSAQNREIHGSFSRP